MRIFDGKTYRDATPAEQAEYERMAAEMAQMQTEPTPEERIAALEAALAERDYMIADLMTAVK